MPVALYGARLGHLAVKVGFVPLYISTRAPTFRRNITHHFPLLLSGMQIFLSNCLKCLLPSQLMLVSLSALRAGHVLPPEDLLVLITRG